MEELTYQEAFEAGKQAYEAENYQQAQNYYREAADIAEDNDNAEGYVDALIEVGETCMHLSDGESMLNTWNTAVAVARETGYEYGLHKALRRLGLIYSRNDYFEDAENCLKESIEIGIRNGFDQNHVTYMKYILQKVLYQQDKYEEALEQALDCEKRVHQEGMLNYIDSLLSDISNIYLMLNDLESARHYMMESFVYCEPENRKVLLQSIGFINDKLGYTADAAFFNDWAAKIGGEE